MLRFNTVKPAIAGSKARYGRLARAFRSKSSEMGELLCSSYALTETNNRRVNKSVANGQFEGPHRSIAVSCRISTMAVSCTTCDVATAESFKVGAASKGSELPFAASAGEFTPDMPASDGYPERPAFRHASNIGRCVYFVFFLTTMTKLIGKPMPECSTFHHVLEICFGNSSKYSRVRPEWMHPITISDILWLKEAFGVAP